MRCALLANEHSFPTEGQQKEPHATLRFWTWASSLESVKTIKKNNRLL
jgi:hypothetical protein